jgi:hypothetical protein
MWIFTEIADAFDKSRAEENAWVSTELRLWTRSKIYAGSPWYRNVAVYEADGVLYAVNKLSTSLASGFIDVLRVGDGVREGGWGYGKDALRLLIFITPILRLARWFLTLVTAVDVMPTMGNCTWVALTRLFRLTGMRPLMQLEQVARAAGLEIAETGGAWAKDLLPVMQFLGVAAREGAQVANLGELATLVNRNPRSVIMFTVQMMRRGKEILHTLLATRGVYGGLKIIDRDGEVVSELAGLTRKYGATAISILANEVTVIVEESLAVKSLTLVPSLLNAASQAATPGPEPVPAESHELESHENAVSAHFAGGLPGTNQGHRQVLAHAHRTAHGLALRPKTQRIYAVIDLGEPILRISQIVRRTGLPPSDVFSGIKELEALGKVQTIDRSPGSDPLDTMIARVGTGTGLRR